MIKIGDSVWHKTQPEFHGIGIVKSQRKDGLFLVEWTSLYGEIWEESNLENELEVE